MGGGAFTCFLATTAMRCDADDAGAGCLCAAPASPTVPAPPIVKCTFLLSSVTTQQYTARFLRDLRSGSI